AALWLPAFQLAMMIIDGLFGGLLKAVISGTGALAGAVGATGGTAMVGAALGAGGVAFAALALAYTLIYVAITVVTAFKASGWVKMALEGGDLAGDFLMKQVT